MKRSVYVFILFGFISSVGAPVKMSSGAASLPAKDTWTSVRSKNFFLVGNASEKDIHKAASRLEQFRDVFTKLFPKAKLSSAVPTRVVVFKSQNAFKPFMPIYQGKTNEVAGYFQPGQDVNYIVLTAELRQTNPFATVFHEFVHALTNENSFTLPAWFNEGLAEYYSTFEITDGDKKVWLGKPVANHVYLLRERNFLPLRQLFEVTTRASEYNERDKRGIFYAESWALVHYLMLGNEGKRRPQMLQFLNLLGKKAAPGEAFQQSFQTDYATIEKELREYIGRNSYPVQVYTANEKLQFDAEMQAAPVSEAEAEFYMGDLLMRMNRQAEAEEHLQRALALDDKLALPHATLGMLRMRQRRVAEAKQHLEKAVALGADNHFVHYYYAYALSREGMNEQNYVTGYAPEATAKMREHLEKAIQLAPEFAGSYYLMAFINLVSNEKLDSAVGQLKRVLTLEPGRQDAALLLAQVYLRQQKYDLARQTATSLARDGVDPQLRAQAQSLLDSIKNVEERLAQFRAEREAAEAAPPPSVGPGSPNEGKHTIPLRRRLDGDKAKGLLTQINCNDKGMTLVIKAGDRTLKFNTTTPERVQFLSFVEDLSGEIKCGPFSPARPVVVTYRSSTDAKAGVDGELIAVEFVKPEQQ